MGEHKRPGPSWYEILSFSGMLPEDQLERAIEDLRQKVERLRGRKKLLRRRQNLSKYFSRANFTQRQRECISLRLEYGLSKSEIARRLGVHRSVVHEHIKAAERKLTASNKRKWRSRS